MKVKRLSIIRALTNFRESFNLFEFIPELNNSSYDYAINLCEEPNANIKHYAFKSM